MKKRIIRKREVKEERHTCGECGRATWYWAHQHLDCDGRPICVSCPFQERKMIRTEYACKKFIEGAPKSGK